MAYNQSQIDKIGNLIIYITEKLGPINKTKLLKLIYILEEESILKGGYQFTDLNYIYMPLGPVCTIIKNQIDKQKSPLTNYIKIEKQKHNTIISPLKSFDNSEFSDFDIEILNDVLSIYGSKNANELIEYTHRIGSPWEKLGSKYNGNIPFDKRTLDLFSLLDNSGIDSHFNRLVKEENKFLQYLRD
jgi:uncharacterized phage-associated protein